LRDILNAGQLADVRAAIERLIAQARLDPTWHAGGTLHLIDLVNDPAFDPVWKSRRLLSAIAHVIGYDLRIGSVTYRAPKPGYGAQTLHADYMQGYSGEYQVATAIVALVDFTETNGPTRIVPGSHLPGNITVPSDTDTPHPDQRLAAREPDRPHPVALHEKASQAVDLLEPEDVLAGEPAQPLRGHAVDAAEVAAIGHRDPEVVGDPAVGIPQPGTHSRDDTPMNFEHILVEPAPPVALVTLNRPKVLNALSPELIGELTAALDALDRDDTVRAVVLTGGARVFAAGADIADMAERSPVDQLIRDQTGRWARITSFSKPLIAAVNGYALGGGCELALMCDLIIAGDSARFGQPEINLGIIAGAGGTQRWTRSVGKYMAMEVNLLGAPLTAQHAHRLGLVNRVVPAEVTIEVATSVARQLAGKAPIALRMAKESVNKALETSLAEGLAAERKNFYFLFATEDQTEGMKAFLEKRKPEFKGR